MAPQNPRDMREYMRTLERLTTQQRAVPAIIGNAVKVIEEKIEEQKVRHPAPPVELEAQTAVYLDPTQKRTLASVIVDFPDVIFNTDGTKAAVDQYELWGRDDSVEREDLDEGIWVRQGTSTTSSISVFGYLPGSKWTFRVRALSAESVGAGEWSEEIVVAMLKDGTPPPQPTAPILTVARGTITVAWDGKAVTGDMPSDLTFVQVAAGTANAPTVEWTRFAPTDRLGVYAGAKYNTPMFFRFRAQDASGNWSAWSETSTAYTTPLVDVDIIISEIDAGKTRIKNAQKILLESGIELDAKLKENDEALAEAEQKLTGPGGLTDRLEEAEVRLDGTATLEQSAELQSELNANKVLLDATEKKITGPGGLTERLAGVDTKLADVGGLTYAAGQTLRQKLAATDTAVSTAQGQVNTLKNTTVPKLSTDLTAATGRITTAEGKLTTAQADLATAKADIVTAKKSITDNAAIMSGAVTRLGTAEQEITASKTRLSTAEGKLTTLQGTTIPALNKDLADAEGRIDSAQGLLDLIPGNITTAKQAAIDAAMADAEAKVSASLEAAKKDAQAKANAAQAAATTAAAADAKTKADKALADAKADATAKANAARADALVAAEIAAEAARDAAGLAGAMGRTWFQAEAPATGATYEWAGVPYKSESIRKVDGVETFRNLATHGTFKEHAAQKITSAGNGEHATVNYIDDPTLGGERAVQILSGGSGYALVGVALNSPSLIANREKDLRIYAKVWSSTTARNLCVTLREPNIISAFKTAAAETWETVDMVRPIPALGVTSQVGQESSHRQAGDELRFAQVMLVDSAYTGPYFDGDTPDERENDLWIDTANGNTPKRWDGTGWVAVTDQAAITAATAAAALDATAKADAAQQAAITAAAADATKKADAAQAAAVTAADIAAKADATSKVAAAEARAAADAKTKADKALADAKSDATSKANAAQTAAVKAAAADAKSQAEAAEARAATTAAAAAKVLADKAQADALAAAKTYADAQADGAGGLALEAAKADATAKANAAKQAAIDAAALDATAKKEEAERVAALDAKTKADKALADAKVDAQTKATAAQTAATNAASADATKKTADALVAAATDAKTKADKALADAKTDATAKANAAQAAAVTAAAADATTKANAAQAAAITAADTAAKATAKAAAEAAESRAAITAAADAKSKADAAQAAALAAAKTYADAQADGAGSLALEEARKDATAKANAAQAAAITAAAADATAKKEAAEATAAADAKTKADKALADAKADATTKAAAAQKAATDAAATDATTKANNALTAAKQDAQTKANAAQAAAIAAADLAAKADATSKVAAAEVRAAADAKTKADKALADAKVDATSKAAAAQKAATEAAAADATSKAEAAEAAAATEAARLAKSSADAAQAAALAAAKTYADAQASGAGVLALEEARADATAKADAAQAAAITAAALDATAKKEDAERVAAADAKTKADKALADAKVDAKAKADAAQTAATTAASADATKKAADAQAAAAADAKTKADAALSDAKADSKTKADAALAAALAAAPRGESVVLNGSFEQDFTAWDKEVTPGDYYGIDETVSRSGTKSFWTTGKGGFRQLHNIPVSAGQTWEMSLWYKTDELYSNSNAGGVRLQAVVKDAWVDAASTTLKVNTEWTRSYARYVVPAGVTQIRPRFAFNYSGGGKCWVDDIELVNITADVTAAADATAKANAALAAAQSALGDTNKQLMQLAANAGNLAPYGDLESLSGTYFPMNAAMARSGERAFTHRITTQAGESRPGDVSVTAGNWYQISYWMKADRDIKVDAGMPLLWVEADGKMLNDSAHWGMAHKAANRGPLSPEWKLITFTIQAPANMVKMRPRFYVWNAATGSADLGATVYMDDLTIKDVTEYMLSLAAVDAARVEAFAAANRASEEARAAAGLANTMGRTWFQADEPPAGVVHSWVGDAGKTQSVELVNGVETRRNLSFNPSFSVGLTGWSHSNPAWFVTSKQTPIPAQHAEFFGQARNGLEMTWTENGTNGAYFGTNLAAPLTEEMPFHSEIKGVGLEGNTKIRLGAEIQAGGKMVKVVYSDVVTLAPGQEYHFVIDSVLPVGADRVVNIFYRVSSPDPSKVLASGALLELGTSGAFFDGDTPDEREMDLWIDTDEGNTPKRWDGTGWVAVTDQKAIETAKAAAAADATTKANAALSAAKADATTKANAAADLAKAAQANAVNVIADPSFEIGVRDFISGRFVYDTTEKRSGTRSVRCNPGSSTMYAVGDFLIRPGETWAVYAWVKVTPDYNGDGTNGKMRLGNGDGSLRTAYAWPKGVEGWTRVGGTVTQGADAPSTTVQVQLSINHSVGNIWVDDLEARNITEELRLEAAAKADATAKADAAREAAITAAEADAKTKADAAQKAAIESAALEAQKKVDAAASTTLTTAATEAQKKADKAKADAITAAAAETLLKANGAREDAIAAAEADAKSKADTAQRLAVEAAALHADQVAAQAKTDAITAAANDATSKANKAKADAVDAAALDASFKADEAERRAKVDAAAAQSRADKAVTDAAAASGLAAGKGKVLVQSAAPGADDRNKMTLWIDTTSGNNTPKMWSTGTTWVAVTDKKATDAAAAAATAKAAADAAAAAAVTAQSQADSAMSAAGSLNQIYYSTKDPSGIAPVGSTWRKQDSAKNIIGEWQYVGGTTPWQAQLVTSQAISNLDLGKLSVGTAAMETAVVKKLVAETASFQTVDAKNIFVTGTASLSEVVAKRLAAETGTFMSITTNQLTAGSADLGTAVAQKIAAATASFQKADISNLTAGTANMSQAVINKLVANTAAFQTVTVDHITATATANLNSVVAQRIAAGTASFQTVDAKNLFVTGTASLDTAVAKRFAAETGTFLELGVDQLVVTGNAKLKEATAERLFTDIFTANKISTNEMLVGSFANMLENPSFEQGYTSWSKTTHWTAETTGGRLAPGAMMASGIVERTFGPTSNRIPVDSNDTYRISGWVRTNATTNPTQGEICWYWYRADGSFIGNNNLNIKDASGTWQYYSEQRKPPAEAALLAVRINATLGHVQQEYWFDDLGVALASDGSLIVQNSITAREIDAEKVAAAVGSFVKADIGNLVVSGSTNLNSVTADRIFTNLFSTRKLYTESLIIGQMGNAIPDPLFTDAEYVRRVNAYSTCTVALSSSDDLALTGTASTTYFRPLGVPQTPTGSKDWIPVKPGQKWRFDVSMSTVKVAGGYITMIGRNVDGTAYTNPPTSSRTPLPVGSGNYSIEIEVPANCYWIMPEMAVPANSGTFWVKRGSMVVREMITPELIVEGGITAKHITASEAMSAKLGQFLKVELVDLVSTGTAKLNTAVVDKLFTETFSTRKLTANQIYVGEGGNLFPAEMNDEAWQRLHSIAFAATAGKTGGTSMLIPGGGTQMGTYFGIADVTERERMPKLVAGQKYRIRANILSSGTIPKSGAAIYLRLYGPTKTAYTWVPGSLIANAAAVAANTWGEVEGIFEVPEDSANLYLGAGLYSQASHSGNLRWSDLVLQEAVTTELIVDGAITTKKLTVTEDMTVELLKAHKVLASEINVNTLAADTAFVGAMEAKLIVSDVFSGKTFTGGTFNGGVFQSTPTSNLGVRMDTSGFHAWNAAKQRTVFIDASTGEMSATGRFETSKLGGVHISMETKYDDDGKRIRPKIAFNSSALSSVAARPGLFTEFDQAGLSPNFGHGSIVLQGAALQGDLPGKSWGYVYVNGDGRSAGMILRGTGVEGTGVETFEGTTHYRGRLPLNGGYNNSSFRTGEAGGLNGALHPGQVTEYTIPIVPATGARIHPFVSVDGTSTAFTHTVYMVGTSSFKIRLWNSGATAANVSGVHWFCTMTEPPS